MIVQNVQTISILRPCFKSISILSVKQYMKNPEMIVMLYCINRQKRHTYVNYMKRRCRKQTHIYFTCYYMSSQNHQLFPKFGDKHPNGHIKINLSFVIGCKNNWFDRKISWHSLDTLSIKFSSDSENPHLHNNKNNRRKYKWGKLKVSVRMRPFKITYIT